MSRKLLILYHLVYFFSLGTIEKRKLAKSMWEDKKFLLDEFYTDMSSLSKYPACVNYPKTEQHPNPAVYSGGWGRGRGWGWEVRGGIDWGKQREWGEIVLNLPIVKSHARDTHLSDCALTVTNCALSVKENFQT